MTHVRHGLLLMLVLVVSGATAQAQPAAPVEELPRIRITDPGRDLFPLALPAASGDPELAKQATEIQRRDLEIVGLFRLIDPASFPPALRQEGLAFSAALWSQVGAQGVAKLQASRTGGQIAIEGRLFQVARGDQAVLTKTYRGPELRALVHEWANDVVAQFTGLRGVFGSRIAFALTGRSGEIATIDLDGSGLKVVTQMKSECMLPSFSPRGTEIAFNSFLRGGADLWVVSTAGGRARRVSSRPGLNTGAVWLADGRSMIVTLSHQGNAELYRLSAADGKEQARLTRGPGIDSSATVSPDGTQVAFMSDRQGTPQIFVMPIGGGAARRLTFKGSNNTTPRWNPRADKSLIAFTGRDERNAFDIFTVDVKTGAIERVTQNQSSNLDPAWSPDGRLLVYASTRGGLFATNPDTRQEVQIWKGAARNPAFGPAPQAGR